MATVKDAAIRTYAGETGDERASRRRGALVEATFALLAEGGERRLRIETVCARAGLNKRYFYESFADIDAAIAAVMQWLADEVIAASAADLDPDASTEVFTRTAISALVAHLTDDPRRARVLLGATATGEAAAAHRATAIRQIAAAAVVQGRSHHHVDVDDPLADLTAALLVGGTSQALLDWLDGRLALSRDELVDELVALWVVVGDGASARLTVRLQQPGGSRRA